VLFERTLSIPAALASVSRNRSTAPLFLKGTFDMALKEYKTGQAFSGVIGRTADVSKPKRPAPIRTHEVAPNQEAMMKMYLARP
jgi:hypothetical protein